jgi:hypothetical protein
LSTAEIAALLRHHHPLITASLAADFDIHCLTLTL